MTIDVNECFVAPHGQLLEGVTYDERNGNLYYLDIPQGLLYIQADAQQKPEKVPRSIKIDKTVGVIGLTEDPNVLVIGAHAAIVQVELTTEKITVLARYPEGNTFEGHELRSNEGSVTPWGTFWVGTMSATDPAGNWGSMWEIDARGDISKVWQAHTTIPNGLNWDAHAKRMYWTESSQGTVYAYDYDAQTGNFDPASKRVFYKSTRFEPDGSCLDSQGNLYVAVWGEGKVHRVNKHGQVDMTFNVPAKNVTCPVFGGPNFSQLYITTAKLTQGVESNPGDLGGALFKVDMTKYGVQGQAKSKFKLSK